MHKTHSNYHLVAVELPFIPKVIDYMHQTIKTYLEREHSILLSVAHTLYVYQVRHSVSYSVKDGSCSCFISLCRKHVTGSRHCCSRLKNSSQVREIHQTARFRLS